MKMTRTEVERHWLTLACVTTVLGLGGSKWREKWQQGGKMEFLAHAARTGYKE